MSNWKHQGNWISWGGDLVPTQVMANSSIGAMEICHRHNAELAELRAELARVKQQSLRVVPVGEALNVWDAGFLEFFTCDHLGVWRLCECSMDHLAPCKIQSISDRKITEVVGGTIVQPVRLERWPE